MAGEGRRLLGEHFSEEHIANDLIEELGLREVTEDGQTIPLGVPQGKVFRFEGPDEPGSYLVSPTESTGTNTGLCCLQEAS